MQIDIKHTVRNENTIKLLKYHSQFPFIIRGILEGFIRTGLTVICNVNEHENMKLIKLLKLEIEN